MLSAPGYSVTGGAALLVPHCPERPRRHRRPAIAWGARSAPNCTGACVYSLVERHSSEMAAVLATSHGAQSSHVRRSRQQALRGETSWRGGGPPPPPCAPSTGAQQQPVRDLGQSGAPQPQQQPQQQPQVDRPPFLVVVEGRNDMQAVRRALPAADVFVLGTSTAADSPTVLKQLATAAPRYRSGLLLLLDPDVAGRQARLMLDERLPGCLHAFLPSPLATARMATR